MEKGCLNCCVYGCKALRGSPQVSLRTYCSAVSLSSGEMLVWLCGWKVGRPSWNTYLLQAYSLDCELGHMGQTHPGCFAYRDSMEAQARFKAQWN